MGLTLLSLMFQPNLTWLDMTPTKLYSRWLWPKLRPTRLDPRCVWLGSTRLNWFEVGST